MCTDTQSLYKHLQYEIHDVIMQNRNMFKANKKEIHGKFKNKNLVTHF